MKLALHTYQRIIDVSLFLVGLTGGIATSLLATAPAFKLLNILGLSFDLLGVLLLTYGIITNPRIKKFIANWGGVFGVSFTGFFFLAFYTGIIIGSKLLGGKDHSLFGFFGPVVLLALFSAYFLEDTVMNPITSRLKDDDLRIKILGGYFVVFGIVIQLYAAFLDLWS